MMPASELGRQSYVEAFASRNSAALIYDIVMNGKATVLTVDTKLDGRPAGKLTEIWVKQ